MTALFPRLRAAAIAGCVAFAAPQAQAAAEIQRVISPGGIEAWLVEEHAIPMVAIEIAFVGGAATEPEDRLGVTRFLSAMLDEGAGDLDSTAFAERAELLAARFSFSANRDAFAVSARMLSDALDDSLALLRSALTEPRFDEEPLRRVRGQILAGLRSDETDPDSLASEAWFAAAFPGHPYGRKTEGTPETVAAITADDLRAARLRALNRSAAVIGVVGAIDAETLGRALDALLLDLPQGPVETAAPTDVAAQGGVTVIPFDAPQSTVLFGHAGQLRDDPDFIPAYVMNYILGGGGFSSRLTVEVREKRGLAYSAYSYLAPFDRAGVIMGGVGTANARVAESVEVIRAEWARMAAEGVSAEELAKAKSFLTGSYALRFDSNARIAANLVALQRDNLGIDYVEKRNALVEAVTLEDVRRVAERWLKPEALSFVVVGQPEGLPVGQ
ncbi:MAG: pitrilysin family protein [Rubrimonas sp.]|uniref:M16 family metallopeptidase n=1 Tax=Rubrimonas sp. TaxID=2036015 RepID=UPI002FDD6DAF